MKKPNGKKNLKIAAIITSVVAIFLSIGVIRFICDYPYIREASSAAAILLIARIAVALACIVAAVILTLRYRKM